MMAGMNAPAARRIHRVFGLLLLLPLAGWCVTGLLFHLKPGWAGAYDMPSLSFEALGTPTEVAAQADWLEMRRLRTLLGEHLLVRTAEQRLHLDPATGAERPLPTAAELTRLLDAALASRPRYGAVASLQGTEAVTETGVRVSLDWQGLRLSQRGRDTDLIDGLYRVHYLQWTGVDRLDKLLASAGLLLLSLLALLGLRLSFGRSRE
jgi:hypothetical protein